MSIKDNTVKLSNGGFASTTDYNVDEFRVHDQRSDINKIVVYFGQTSVALPEADWMKVVKAILRLRWENPTGAKIVDCDGCDITLPETELIMQADAGRSVLLCPDCIQARHAKAAVPA